MLSRYLLLCLCLFFTPAWGNAAEVDFSNDIRPILARKCYSCHGPTEQEAGLALHDFASATAETESGIQAIVPKDLEASELVYRIEETDPDLRMPPAEHDPLTAEEVKLIKDWISEGAEYNQHWAFQDLPQVEVPDGPSESGNPIDEFISAQLDATGLQAAPLASKRVLIRRLYYDLTGLPPMPEEVRQFVENKDPAAFEKLVDQLLASPQYGERWGRHWLDVVRYAETNSFERDSTKPNAWKYRDYVIRSFNEDKPYDQFLREQLAGDELDEVTKETLTATGFYRLGIWDDEPADPLLARYEEFDSILTTVSQGMLGLTVNCARCHDHKIDPIPQADYYRLLSFFQELTPYATRGDANIYSQTDVTDPQITKRYQELDEKLRQLREKLYQIEQTGVVKMPAPDQRATETRRRAKVLENKLQQYLEPEAWKTYTALKEEERALEQEKRDLPDRETVMSVAKVHLNHEPTTIMLRGNPHVPGDVVTPGFPELFGASDPIIPEIPEGADRSGKRKLLADWITSRDNKLTARVFVNRIWQHHFGRGIVRSPNNFGLLGTPPTHPDLLNWLAGYFMDHNWQMKPLHKLIVMSEAYQRSSKAVPESLAKDPTNDNFWRFDLRRLSAEEIRDSILAVTGKLNEKSYGPSFYPQLSEEVLATQSRPGEGWGNSSQDEQNRRSVYIFIKRSLIPPELSSFDFPETDTTCEARFMTIQPAQALAMINGTFLNMQAENMAERLVAEAGEDRTDQVRRGLALVTSRTPTDKDIEDGLQLWTALRDEHGLSEADARKYFCLYALNLNEFLFVD